MLLSATEIRNSLIALDCHVHIFAEISGLYGKTRMSEGLNGTKPFSTYDLARLSETIERMKELQNAVIVGIAWSKVDKVRAALAARLAATILREEGDHQLDRTAEIAAHAVTVQQSEVAQGSK
jgi:hypothetical protein